MSMFKTIKLIMLYYIEFERALLKFQSLLPFDSKKRIHHLHNLPFPIYQDICRVYLDEFQEQENPFQHFYDRFMRKN